MTLSHVFLDFFRLPKYDLMWYVARDHSIRCLQQRTKACRYIRCLSKPNVMSAVFFMHYGHTSDTCLFFLVDVQPFGACKTFLEAMMMVNNAFKVGGLERVAGGLKWPHFARTCGVERVALPKLADNHDVHDMALTMCLMDRTSVLCTIWPRLRTVVPWIWVFQQPKMTGIG